MTTNAVGIDSTIKATQRSVLFMVVATAIFVVSDTLIKLTARHMPTSEILVLRSLFSAVVTLGWMATTGGLAELRFAFRLSLTLRGVFDGLVSITYILGLALLPLADCSAILLASPLMITALSGPWLGEHVGWRRWLAVIVGFCGMLLVLKPGSGAFSLAGLLVVVSTALVAVRDVYTRRIDRAVPSRMVLFVTLVMAALCGAALAPFERWVWPSSAETISLSASGLLVVVGHYLVIMAFRSGDVSVVSPFRYTIIIWSILSGMLVWGDRPDLIAIAGIALIILSGLYTLRSESSR